MNARLRAIAPYAIVLAAAVFLFWSAQHFDYTPRGNRPGPDVWPRAILLLMIATCIVQVLIVLRRPDAADAEGVLEEVIAGTSREAEPGALPAPPSPTYPWLLAAGIALTIGYVSVLGTLGFYTTTALYIAAMIRTGRYRRWPVIVAVALLGALAFMFVFMKVVYLSLPIGRAPFDVVSLTLMQIMGIR